MQYRVQHFRSATTGKVFHHVVQVAEGDMEADWRASVTSSITGDPLYAIYYPSDIGCASFAERVNRRLQRNDLRDVRAIEWGKDEHGYSVATKYCDVFDPTGYAVLIGDSSIDQFRDGGGTITVYGTSL